MHMGEKIRALRKERGMKQIDLAQKTGITRVSIGNYERGDRTPPVDIAGRIAKALGVTLAELYNDDGETLASALNVNDMVLSEEAVAEHMKMYRTLDAHGLEIVDTVTGAEYRRMHRAFEIPGADDEE